MVQDQYSWDQIAVVTRKVYESVLDAYKKGNWKMPSFAIKQASAHPPELPRTQL